MRILRDWLAAYRDRTAAYRERTATLERPADQDEPFVGNTESEPDHPTNPFQAWMQENYETLSDDEVHEIIWARGRLSGTEHDGEESEARAILTRHAVPGSAWK